MDALRERVKWRCRRGLLELDLFFTRFNATHLGSLNPQQLENLLELLSSDDHELWAMISCKEECEVKRWQDMVALLRQSGPEICTPSESNLAIEGTKA